MLDIIRRFGPSYCDLSTMVSNVAFLLRMSLINIESRYTQRIPIVVYVIQILSGVVYFYVFQFSVIWFVLIRCKETKDFIAASVVISLGACSVTGVAKLIYIRCHINTVKDLVQDYLAYDYSMISSNRFNIHLLNGLGDVKKRAFGFWFFLTINGLIYVIVAIVRPGRHLVEDLFVIYGLEPMFETPNYEIAFIVVSISMYFGITAETNTSALLIILTGYIESQILALSGELDKLWDNALYQVTTEISEGHMNNDQEKKIIQNECIRKLLRDIVIKHTKSIHLLCKVEQVFRGAMSIEFGVLTLALIAELLGGLESTYLQLPYTLIQITMDCFIGQRLIDASLVLTNSIYGCKWEKFDVSNQKIVYMMLMISQKTLTISVGGVTVLSFSYLKSVLNSIYSVYTTLRSRI